MLTVGDAHAVAHRVEHELLHHVAHLDGADVHVEPASRERDTADAAAGHHP